MERPTTRTTARQGRSQRSVDDILNAASSLIATAGIDATSMSDIAKRAEVSVGRVYYWFETKDDIIQALNHRGETVIEEFFAGLVVDDSAVSTPDLITTIVDATSALVQVHPEVLELLSRTGDDTTLRSSVLQRVARLVQARVSACPDDEAAAVALTIVNAVVGALASVQSADGDSAAVRTEVIYLISAYLACRFPATANPSQIVAPSQSANRTTVVPDTPILPFIGTTT